MHLEGSCYCGAVTFSLQSHTPYPYMRCYCSICRKSSGGGGYGINIMGDAATFTHSDPHDLLHAFHARVDDPDKPGATMDSHGKRFLCRGCGSALWASDPRWPAWIYPVASAIDTPLPEPPEINHIMLDFRAPWVTIPEGPGHHHFPRYPTESIEDWHRRLGVFQE